MSIEKRVSPISEETRYAIKRKSAYSLPQNPSERGMGADEIKKAFYAPVTETASSVLSELDRVIQETNEVFEETQGDRSDKLAQAKRYTEEREAAIREYTDAENAEQDRVTAELAQDLSQTNKRAEEQNERLTLAEQTLSDTVLPGMDDLNERKAEAVSPTTSGELVHTGNARIMGHTTLSDTTVEGTLSNPRLDTAYEAIEQSKLDILRLSAELSGKGRIFSLPDFSSLVNFLQYGGRGEAQISLMENGRAVCYTASELKTGDVIYIKEVNVPDVWWITTDSEEGAYSYPYNGVDYRLVGHSEYGGAIVGQVQPLETDYLVIEQHATAASLSAQNAASRAAEAATAAGQAAGYAEEARRAAEEAEEHSKNSAPTATAKQTTEGIIITVTDKNGATTATIKHGAAGITPRRGVDYWTETDRSEIVEDVLNALPNAEGVSF